MRGLHFIKADYVVAVLGLDRTFDLPDRHAEQRIGKGRNAAATLGPAEVAAVLGRAGVLGVLLGEFAKILARLGLRQHLLGQGERRGIVLGRDRDQDVARMALLGDQEAALGLVIGGMQVRIRDGLL